MAPRVNTYAQTDYSSPVSCNMLHLWGSGKFEEAFEHTAPPSAMNHFFK